MSIRLALVIATATLCFSSTPVRAQRTPAPPQPVAGESALPQSPPNICGQYGSTVYDMVQWIVQTYPGADTSYLGQQNNSQGPISDFSKWDSVKRRFYRVTDIWGSNEVYDYDDNYIYNRRETKYQNPTDFYLSTSNYIWAPRYAITANTPQHQACFNTRTSSAYDEYSGCQKIGSGGAPFLVSVSGPFTLTLGGNVGTVQALRLNQTNLNVFETESYWYARPYGFVYYERRDAGGNLLVSETHNTIYTPEPPLALSCGIGY